MDNNIKRKFYPGDKWLYAKIYASSTQCEHILTKRLTKLINSLTKQSLIQKWFFIRYADPDFHIRLRFLLENTEDIAIVMLKLHNALRDELSGGIINKIQYDTYNREMERYVENNIENSESLFYIDSIATLKILDVINLYKGTVEDRIAIACKSIDQFLSDFNYKIELKLRIMTVISNLFCREFGYNDNNKTELNNLFRNFSPKIELFMMDNSSPQRLLQQAICKIIEERSYNQIEIISVIKMNMKNNKTKQLDLIQSYIHMMMNRFFCSHNRQYEMLVYYFLKKEYTSIIARLK